MVRSNLLRENGKFISSSAFTMRLNYLIAEKEGVITKGKEKPTQVAYY